MTGVGDLGLSRGDNAVWVPAFAGTTGKLPPVLLPPRREIHQRLRIGRGIEPQDAAALADLLGDEILERGHLDGLVGDLVGEMRGDHDDAVAVAEDDVAGKHRRVAAADRHVDLDRLMQRQVGRRARAVVIGGKAERWRSRRNRESRRR